jgi:hypothetical protein
MLANICSKTITDVYGTWKEKKDYERDRVRERERE